MGNKLNKTGKTSLMMRQVSDFFTIPVFYSSYKNRKSHFTNHNYSNSQTRQLLRKSLISAISVIISRTMGRSSRTIYVGNLPGDIRETEIEDLFYKYGRIVDIDLKTPSKAPAYAFVEFEDSHDAEDAIYGRDGYNFDGYRLRVEPAYEERGSSSNSGSGRRASRRSDHKGRSSSTIYVGNLPGDIRESEIEDLFHKYGPIVDIDLKTPRRPPIFAFVEFEDPRDADDAIRGRDGYNFDGHRLRVELAHGGRGLSSKDRISSYSNGSSRGGLSKHSDYRVSVTGLPYSASWQDLKVKVFIWNLCVSLRERNDGRRGLSCFCFINISVTARQDHMRRAGDVCFSEVYRDRDGMRGIVDYTNYDDMKYAIRKLDDSLFKNQFSRSYIRVEEYDARRSYSRSPSRSVYSRSRSPSRSYSDMSRRSSASVSRSVSPPPLASRYRSRSRTPTSSPAEYRRDSESPWRRRSRSRSIAHSQSELSE
ncbi:hypothetical protein SASPL_111558 [Salvia splendens]|uniref:RRM domain-containing protein n=1 Tax=Salvia splendens TaxID=180675 RepID=A0A8X9A4F7_SALSN|nr:hypothetical protein SASPL_111558 [Salvia splendens]